MKLRLFLFLFLFLACTLLAGKAMAQGCTTLPIRFPQPNDADQLVPSGTCIANADSDSATGQGGRLRWDEAVNGGSTHQLDLFDSDDGGTLLWCANSADTNGGSSGPTNCLHPPSGSILCAQQDGNLVIYKPSPGQTSAECDRTEPDSGLPVWASGTNGDNDGNELLKVAEDPTYCVTDFFGPHCRTLTGDRAILQNNEPAFWATLGFTD